MDLFDRARRALASDTRGGVIKLTSGAAAGQLIAALALIFVARIYTPAAYGVFVVFVAVASVAITAAPAKYDMALMNPGDEDKALRLALVGLVTSALVGLFVGIASLFLPAFQDLRGALGQWLFLLPVSVIAGGATLVGLGYATRQAMFGVAATRTTIKSLVTASVQVCGGAFVKANPVMLAAGYTAGQVFASSRLLMPIFRAARKQRPTPSQLVAAAKEYRRFPFYSMPSGLLNALFLSVPVIYVGATYGTDSAGFFGMSTQILTLPMAVVGGSVAQVFYRQANIVRQQDGNVRRLFDATAKRVAFAALLPAVLTALGAPFVVPLVFGDDWAQVGQLIQIMMPWAYIRLVVSPVSGVAMVAGKNRRGLLIQIALLIGTVGVMLASSLWGWQFQKFVIALSATNAVLYLLALYGYRTTTAGR